MWRVPILRRYKNASTADAPGSAARVTPSAAAHSAETAYYTSDHTHAISQEENSLSLIGLIMGVQLDLTYVLDTSI